MSFNIVQLLLKEWSIEAQVGDASFVYFWVIGLIKNLSIELIWISKKEKWDANEL
jgi:hypothetical protein